MNRALRILSYLVVGLFLLALVLFGLFTMVQRRPFPQTDGRLAVPGLQSEVTVYRDEYGVPHIYADSLDDLLFAQGYVHAQDRFWQMEWWRHISQGRLSEIVGEAALGNDKFIRTMGWNRMAQTTVDYYKENQPEYYALLERYADGVNAYIADKSPSELSLNYTILNAVYEPWEIEPWEPVHTVGWGVVMSFDLADDIDRELSYAELIEALGEGLVDELVPPYPYHNRPVIAPTDELVSQLPTAVEVQNWVTAVDWQQVNTNLIGEAPAAFGRGAFIGSNNWVISGEHTDTGQPLLANDPHLGIQLPSIWYQVGLHAPDYNVVGFSFAGVPGVVIGHNDDIAWGVTNTGADVQDLYIERIVGDQYEYMGEMHDLEIIEERIKVNGGEDVLLPVRITRHGPIISDVRTDVEDVLAVRWVAQEPSRILQAVLLLNQAGNYEQFREALQYWDIPSQNVVYADKEGNIAYQMPGLTPIRQNGIGRVPSPGWTGEYEWLGWIPYEELPALLNPEQGYIVTANHAIVDEQYPHYITRDWDNGDRGQRIVDMIEAILADGRKISQADIAVIHHDSFSLLARTYTPFLANLQTDDERVQEAIEILRNWDGQERRDSVATTLFEMFQVHLHTAVVADELGEEHAEMTRSYIFLHDLAGQTNSPWWDNVNTPEIETREIILLQALTEAVDWLEENVDGRMESWEWGKLHTATFVSQPLGESGIGPIESIINRGPYPADGGRAIVNANSWSTSNPAAITIHPSMRMIIDLSNFDASQTVIPTGQSGHPGHPNYDSEIELWIEGEYHPLWWSRAEVEENSTDTLVLTP